MKILRTEQIRKADLYTIENEPIKSIDLMERAAFQCTTWIENNIELSQKIMIFAGNGSNGGDGLAIARQLTEKKAEIEVYILNITDKSSDDFATNLKRLEKQNRVRINTITNKNNFPEINKNSIVIDAIFGSGLSKPIKGMISNLIEYINNSEARIISIDIPSGLFGEENHNQNQTVINATDTLTLELPYLSFFFHENQDFVGDFHILPIGLSKEFIEKAETPHYTIESKFIHKEIKPRKKFSHKGDYGHGLLIAGSLGKMGAALMAAKACHRTGIGLLTVHVPKCGAEILQTASPETMLTVDQQEELSSEFFDLSTFSAIAIGPGIGLKRPTRLMLKVLIETYKKPIIFDADAITIIGDNKDWLNRLPKNSIFTPHPKEFERIAGTAKNHYERNKSMIEFSKKYGVYVVLKGAYTKIACPDGTCFFNTTGNPGMAAGGSGDVLTGMILSLLAQGYSEKQACKIGVYLHGLAGDIAAKQFGTISMLPTDLINNISKAFETVFKI
jgi:NAD(P)H-hydrate epimerase